MNRITDTKSWIASFVIEHNICPFAAKAFMEDNILFSLAGECKTVEEQVLDFDAFVDGFDTSTYSNGFWISNSLLSFDEYYDLYLLLQAYLDDSRFGGKYQLVCFHPNFEFGDLPKDDIYHKVNQSPYPMIHILRVAEVTEAIQGIDSLKAIFDANRATLERLYPTE